MPPRRALVPRKMILADSQKSWLANFLEYIAHERQLAPTTCFAYKADLIRFYRWLGSGSIPELTPQDLSDFSAYLKTAGLSPSSLARNLTSLRVFFRFLLGEGKIDRNVADLLISPKKSALRQNTVQSQRQTLLGKVRKKLIRQRPVIIP